MDYDVEREKQKSEGIRKAFREMFPLAAEEDLPWAVSHIQGFLKNRIRREVEEGTHHWTARIVRVLCEVSPPKTHVEDMARIVVEKAKLADRLQGAKDEFLKEALVALSGAVCTPERGYGSDGGYWQLLADIKALRKMAMPVASPQAKPEEETA